VNGKWPDFESPFCDSAMLMDPGQRRVDENVFEIRIIGIKSGKPALMGFQGGLRRPRDLNWRERFRKMRVCASRCAATFCSCAGFRMPAMTRKMESTG
jgi:hypothetical protein